MKQIKHDLSCLCQAPGAAGLTGITETAVALLRPLVDQVETDTMGNVLGYRRAADSSAPTLLLEAHLDEIGFLVTHIDRDGFVHVASAGGIDERVLTAQEVLVHGDEVYRGVFCSTPPHLADKDGNLPELSKRGIDVGMSAEQAADHIPLGSRVTFAPSYCELNDTVISAKALDDRAGLAAILHCLRQIDQQPPVNIVVAFCVQEELGCRGSGPAVRRLRPTAALVTDVSFALTPDADPHHCGKQGEGVMIGISPVLSTAMTDALFHLAKQNDIRHQTEVMGGTTGTDADRISTCLEGIPCALLSIPQRYMHTPIEAIDVRDIMAVGDLMAAYIRQGGAAIE